MANEEIPNATPDEPMLTLTSPPDLVMCAVHGEVERGTVWADVEPEVVYNYCGKCYAASFAKLYPVTEIQP